MKPKKFLAVVTAAAMITANSISFMLEKFVNLPVFNANAADIVASGECGAQGDNVTWKLDSEGTLTISGEGEMKNWQYDGSPWHGSREIKNIVIEDKITNIGDFAFDYCRSIISVIIPNSVKYIGNRAFCSCENLTSITLPDSITSIGIDAFSYCYALTSITIPNSITIIEGRAFCDCKNLTSITIPYTVTSIGGDVFLGTPWLEAQKEKNPLVIVNGILIDTTNCTGDVNIPDNVICIADRAFERNYELKSIFIPHSVKKIGNSSTNPIFGLNRLEAIEVDESNEYYKSIDNVLFDKDMTTLIVYPCGKSDKTYTIPEGVSKIDEYAFFICEILESITINNPKCEIYDSDNTIFGIGTIYGYEGSTAQAYAEKYNRTFVALDDENPVTTTAITTTSTSTTTSVTAATTTTPPTTTEPAYLLGDVNEDGSVDSSDASLVLAEYAKIQTGGSDEFTETQHKAADVNNDDVVDSSDASKILAYYAMISTGKKPTWD